MVKIEHRGKVQMKLNIIQNPKAQQESGMIFFEAFYYLILSIRQ